MKNKILYSILLFCMSLCLQGMAQTTVRGRVLDEDGKALRSVTVINVSTARQLVATDANGGFSVSVASGTTLLFKLVGYKEKRVSLAAGQTSLTVNLEPSSTEVDEVVVTRGYVKRPKETSTGASNIITAEDIRDIPGSLETLLQGKAPGLNIQVNTGAPGFRGTTQIRGLSTLSTVGSGNESILMPTSPLYVIDGVPLDADRASEMGLQQQGPGVSPLSMIPPEDIESIEILKDAQATSLYGSLAAYGVVIINTKRGNSEVPRINYVNNSFMRTPPKLRETLGGNLERRLKLEQIFGNALTQADIDRIQTTPHLSDSLNAYFNNSTNWQDLYFQTTYNHSHNLSVDGGNSILSYKANIGYYSETGIIRNTGFDRYSTNLRMDYSPDSKLRFTGQVFAQLGKINKGDGSGILQTGVAAGGLSSTLLPPPSFYSVSSEYISSISTNNENGVRLIRPYVEGSYQIIDGLRITSALSYEFVSSTEDTFSPAAANNQFSKVYSFAGRQTQLYSRSSLNYSKTFNESHNIFINLFNEVRNVTRQDFPIQQDRTPNDNFQGPLGYDGFFSRGGGLLDNFKNERALSFALSTSYDYKRKYILDLSYRMDGSSGNGFGNLYTKNPAIGLRWNAHNEEWIKDAAPWLSLGSIRGSWGINVMPNSTLERIYGRYDITGNYNQQQGVGIRFGQIPNPNLKPTTSMQYNFGLDIALFNNRIDFVYDTYYKKVDNLLFDQRLNSTVAFDVLASNDAAIANYGHELALNIRPLRPGGDFSWTFSINGALNKDILLKLPAHYGGQFIKWNVDNLNGQHNIFRVGTATMSNYLFINEGVYSRDEDVPIDPTSGLRYRNSDGTFFQAGDPIWKDMNGDYILDNRDMVRTGNNQPLITGGVQNTFSYKNIQFSIYASYTAKRTILNNALAERMGLMANPFGQGKDNKVVVPLDGYNMWLQPGDVAMYPYAYAYTRSGTIRPFRYDQTLWAENGSYFKINNMILAYNFNRGLLSRYGLERVRVYASLDNVVTFSTYSGPNPENVTSMGRDLSNGYPIPRTYNIGLNLSF
ncbi:TonB-linked SusC/RagA family outer membrane protein [Sphingobacterium alimentarium]|uniref:TonB-linked SusC/RagA family outer membrane protein n=2 Tax=Sphingobacterium alimentarium TaxID=797292 RepID=A0A4R3VYC2_9SPHI|nr:TonB-linked SusC/RagA family outer membrane protein [Sphingobacterium alimentarium]